MNQPNPAQYREGGDRTNNSHRSQLHGESGSDADGEPHVEYPHHVLGAGKADDG